MAFKLPTYNELSEKQMEIVNISAEDGLIVTGPPGTGKSVLAVYLAEKFYDSNYNILFLVYNKPLKEFIASAVESLDVDESIVKTWNSWINQFYRENFHERIGTDFNYDWDEINSRFDSLGICYDHIIIDEAQDFPKELLSALSTITTGMTCFLDENQTIGSEFTSIDDIENILPNADIVELTENFRNTEEIINFASLYNPDDSEAIYSGEKPRMIHCTGYGHSSPKQLGSKIAEIIEENYKLDTIGVFVNPTALNNTYNELNELLDDRDVYMYKPKTNYSSINFDNPGVYVLSFGTMKGLEFDAVILPKCESIKKNASDEIDKNRFYVAVTRASEKVLSITV